MKWAWKIASFAEIQIFVHATFVVIPALVLFETLAGGASLGVALSAVFFVLAVFGCVLLHELGHALMAARYGIGTRRITLLPIGGLAQLERMPEKPRQELAVALAGPVVNVVIAASLFLGIKLAGGLQNVESLSAMSSSWTVKLMVANVVLVLFNLLPAFPMDGGRVVRAPLGHAHAASSGNPHCRLAWTNHRHFSGSCRLLYQLVFDAGCLFCLLCGTCRAVARRVQFDIE